MLSAPKWFYPPGKGVEGGRVFSDDTQVPAGWSDTPTFAANDEAASEKPASRSVPEAAFADVSKENLALKERAGALEDLNKAKDDVAQAQGDRIVELHSALGAIAEHPEATDAIKALASAPLAPAEAPADAKKKPAKKAAS